MTNDTDNAFGPKPVTEIDGQQTEWLVPMDAPERVGDRHANTAKAPLVATASVVDLPELPGLSNEPEPDPTPTPSTTPTPTPSPTTDDTAAARGVESTVCNAAVESKGHCNDGESTGTLVEVEAKISLGKYDGDTHVLSGAIRPQLPRTEVLLQRRTSSGWITVAADRLNRHYRFALKESLSSGRYRVLWEQQDPSIARSDLRFRFTG